jgi:LmbE family N-acetylglucosaminyl deacetylase
MGVFYDRPSLATVSSVVRSIRPQIILTHSVQDYMEDHQNVSRLITSAAFGRAMPNFSPEPPEAPYSDPVRLYHAPPHGLLNGLGKAFRPDFLIDVSTVIEAKSRMLACHESQFAWLDDSQGMDTPVAEMKRVGRALADLGSGLEYAEGWRRHAFPGFCSPDYDPLCEVLRDYLQNPNPLTR